MKTRLRRSRPPWVARVGQWMLGGVLLSCAIACGRPALTPAVISRFSLDERVGGRERLSTVQVYASETLDLVRFQDDVEATASELKDTTVASTVRIRRNTPGAILGVQRDEAGNVVQLLVGFDPKTPHRTLTFARTQDMPGTDDEHYVLAPTRGLFVQYGGPDEIYSVAEESMWGVHLVFDGIDRRERRDLEKAPGWELESGAVPQTTPSGSVAVEARAASK